MTPFIIVSLKLARQCDFSDMNDRMIDAIIFGTSCIKAQDKLLQTPKMLSLQQCLTVCRHYESLNLHIQQIRPDKHVEYLKKNATKSQSKTKQNHRIIVDLSPREENLTKGDDIQFQMQSEQSQLQVQRLC